MNPAPPVIRYRMKSPSAGRIRQGPGRPGAWVGQAVSSSETFQYASLRNRDQLAIRTDEASYSGFQHGRTGTLRSFIPACSGVRFALRALHETQARTQFSQVVSPPRERGSTWSMVNSSVPG